MVFSNLQSHEKDAFFSLLDEYFTSRPDIFSGSGDAAGGVSSGAAASAVHRALASNPEATSKLVSAGLKHGVPKNSPYSEAASNPELTNAAGRVAAASLAFSSAGLRGGTLNRSASNASTSPPPIAEKPSSASGLTSSQRFGSVDTSSKMNMFSSLAKSNSNKNSPPPVIPSAFGQKKNAFAPPPSRTAAVLPVRQQPQEEEEPEEEEEETAGEWAEALYDYETNEKGDLPIKEGQQVLVTERTSDDWWTGEVDGRSGLFPASYVKLL